MYIHNFLVLPRMLLFNYGNFAQCRFSAAPISEALVSSVSRRVRCHLCAIFHHGSGTVLMQLHVVLLVLGEVEMIFLSFSILTVVWLLFLLFETFHSNRRIRTRKSRSCLSCRSNSGKVC
jgi:hypothetical protein